MEKKVSLKITVDGADDGKKKVLGLKSSFLGLIEATKVASRYAKDWSDRTDKLATATRLMTATFGDLTPQITKFTNELATMTGIPEYSLRSKSTLFGTMAESLGMATDNAEKFSEELTKMSTKLSMIYNLNFEDVSQMLQNVIQGKGTSFASKLGMVVNAKTMQNTLDELGISAQVDSLNTAEQAILRYLTVQRQLESAEIDYSEVVNNVAYQKQQLTYQVERLKTALGNALYPVLQSLLPILNAVLIVVTNIVTLLGTFMGFKLDNNIGDISSSLTEGANAWGGYAGAIQKANTQLRSFDKLNNLKTPTPTTSSGIGVPGVNQGLLDAMDEYNEKMFSVSNKAKDLAEQMMKILGFHKEFNTKTGEWEWKWGGLKATIKGVTDWFDDLNPKVQAFIEFLLLIGGAKIIYGVGKLFGLFGENGLLGTLGKIGDKMKKSVTDPIKNLSSTDVTNWDKFKGAIVGVAGAIGGIFVQKAGTTLITDSLKRVALEGKTTATEVEKYMGIITTTIGGVLSGASIGTLLGGGLGIGTLIGGIGGLVEGVVVSVSTATKDIDEEFLRLQQSISDNQEIVNDKLNEWNDLQEKHRENYEKNQIEIDYYNSLKDELETIVDENGKIKKGYEDRAEVITNILGNALGVEFTIVDNQIQKWSELGDTIDEVIDKKEIAILMENLEENYATALTNQSEAQQKYAETIKDTKQAEKELTDSLYKSLKRYGYTRDEIQKIVETTDLASGNMRELGEDIEFYFDKASIGGFEASWSSLKYAQQLTNARNAQDDAQESLENYNGAIADYREAQNIAINGTNEDLLNFLQNVTDGYGKSVEEQKTNWENMVLANETALTELEENQKNYDKNDYERRKKQYEDNIKLAKEKLAELETQVIQSNDSIGGKTIEQWGEMANNSQDKFVEEFAKLPQRLRDILAPKLYQNGVEFSDEIQRGLNSKGITVDVHANASYLAYELSQTVKNFTSKLGWGVPAHAEGGFPEDGLFLANHNELVGKFSNGKTAVANNEQIQKGIAEASYEAMMRAFSDMGGFKSNTTIVAEGDTQGLLNFIKFKQKEDDRQYGL